jgi:lipid II:glycine glycyltransferase (peptidoglycan interpeptide bridge formation enzyme)
MNYLRAEGNKKNVLFARLSPLIPNNAENINVFKKFGFIDAPIHAMDGEYCWVLDLDKSEDELLTGMRKTTRYLIRQAIKAEVKITRSTNSDDLSDFFSLYRKTAERHHFVAHTGIEEEFNIFRKDKEICLFQGFYQQKLISSALILFYQNQAIYHHSASIDQKIPVNYLLQWEVIKEAKSRKMKIYNFWGIAPENSKRHHPWQGLSLFKKGFGGRAIEYLHAKDVPFRFGYWKSYTIDLIRKMKKGY